MTTRINFSDLVNFTEKQNEANEALKRFKFVVHLLRTVFANSK